VEAREEVREERKGEETEGTEAVWVAEREALQGAAKQEAERKD
jgi:hypothetical protein